MKRLTLIFLLFFIGVSAYSRHPYDYSGTWTERSGYDGKDEDDTFITLKMKSDFTHTGELVYRGVPFAIKCDKPTFQKGTTQNFMNVAIYHRGNIINHAKIRLYPHSKNRVDFIAYGSRRFQSIFDMGCSEIAAEELNSYYRNHPSQRPEFRNKAYKPNYKKAVTVAKNLFIAVANGDVESIKQLTTQDFFRRELPMSDERIKAELLSVPYDRRAKLVDHILNNCITSTIPNRADNAVTVILTNNISGKEITYRLVDKSQTNDWKIDNCSYPFIPH